MSRSLSPSAANPEAATPGSALPAGDRWAEEMVQFCSRTQGSAYAHRTLWSEAYPQPSTSGNYHHHHHVIVDEDETNSSSSSSVCIAEDGANAIVSVRVPVSSAGQPHQQSIQVPPTSLVQKAYRLEVPCERLHSPGDTLNCAGSPTCYAGLQAVRTDNKSMEDCLEYVMGAGPQLLALPHRHNQQQQQQRKVTQTRQKKKEGDPSARDAAVEEGEEEVEAAAETETEEDMQICETIADDFPCFWRGLGNMGNTCYFNAVLQMLFATARVRRAILADGQVLGPTAEPTLASRQEDHHASTAAVGVASAEGESEDEERKSIGESSVAIVTAQDETTGRKCGASSATQDSSSVETGIISIDEENPASQQLSQSGLKELLAQMAFSRASPGADPSSFISFLSLDPAVQQDAQEFFTLLIDWLGTHCGVGVKQAVVATFAGTLLYDRRCGACGRSVKRAEPYMYLSLPVRATLHESLADFLLPSEVDGFVCEACGVAATATSHQYLRSLPEVLVFHLNRFEFDLKTLQRRKVLTAVNFPVTLDMAPYERQWHAAQRQQQQRADDGDDETSAPIMPCSPSDEDYTYELRGVLNHEGSSALSGHYTYYGKVATAQQQDGGSNNGAEAEGEDADGVKAGGDGGSGASSAWLAFNDTTVRKLRRFHGVSSASKDAYMLIYYRKGGKHATTTTSALAVAKSSDPPAAPSSSFSSSAVATTPMNTENLSVSCPPWAPPVPAEFPAYLRRYVARLNNVAIEARSEWLSRKEHVRHVTLRLWCAAADAVFASPPSLLSCPSQSGTTTVASKVPSANATAGSSESAAKQQQKKGGGGEDDVYCVPTVWLQAFGRLFLPPFVDVGRFGGSGEPARKRPLYDLSFSSPSVNPLDAPAISIEALTAPPSSVVNGVVVAGAATGPTLSSGGGGAAPIMKAFTPMVAGTVVGETQGVCARGLLEQGARQHNLSHGMAALLCSHSRLAPWGAYKVVTRRAFRLILEYLAECGAHPDMNAATGSSSLAPTTTTYASALGAASSPLSSSSDSITQCFRLGASACATCAAIMAETVLALARSAQADTEALALLWGQSLAEVGSLQRQLKDDQGAQTGKKAQYNTNEPVFISEDVAVAWEQHMQVKQAWYELAKNEGYTGAFATRRRGSASVLGDGGSAAAPFAKMGSNSSTVRLANAPLMRLFALDADTNTLGAAGRSIRCLHGAVAPGAVVRKVPERVRCYLAQRIPEILQREAIEEGRASTPGAKPVMNLTAAALEKELLPYIPVTASTTTTASSPVEESSEGMECGAAGGGGGENCHLCFKETVKDIAARNRRRHQRQDDAKRLPHVFLAGKLTSHAAMAEMLPGSGVESEEQLLLTQHPNRTFFKRPGGHERVYREHIKAWKEAQTSAVAAQEATVEKLRIATERQQREDAKWQSIKIVSRRGGGMQQQQRHSRIGPSHQQLQLEQAEQELAVMKQQQPPDYVERLACLPTWWVEQWYRRVMRDSSRDGAAVNSADEDNNEDVQVTSVAAAGEVPPPVSFDRFCCPHGGTLAHLHWLNPADAFWQGSSGRGKRAEALWNAAESAGEPTTSWLPPLLILPVEEYMSIICQFKGPALLDGTGDASGALSGDTEQPPLIQVVQHNDRCDLSPAPCAECCASLVKAFDDASAMFTYGTLKLQLHLKKSKRTYYDASGIMTSRRHDCASDADQKGGEGGIHYYTSLEQLRVLISEYAMTDHGLLVPADKLEVLRGRGKPLKLVSPVEVNAPSPSPSSLAATAAAPTTLPSVCTDDNGKQEEEEQVEEEEGATTQTATATVPNIADRNGSKCASLDEATLYALGIRDGDTLVVNLTEAIATPYEAPPSLQRKRSPGGGASTAGTGGKEEEEEWEEIPPELLAEAHQRGIGGEHTAAFAETRLQGSSSSGGGSTAFAKGGAPPQEVGMACSVCTFLNAPGMVCCEMCEAPLPSR